MMHVVYLICITCLIVVVTIFSKQLATEAIYNEIQQGQIEGLMNTIEHNCKG